MYGTVARYRIKPGMEQRLLNLERDIRGLGMKGFICEFIVQTDADPNLCYELVVFESKEGYQGVGELPGWDAINRELTEIVDGEIDWNPGEILYANQVRTPPNVW